MSGSQNSSPSSPYFRSRDPLVPETVVPAPAPADPVDQDGSPTSQYFREGGSIPVQESILELIAQLEQEVADAITYIDNAIATLQLVPPGGTAGQALIKDTGNDFDTSWGAPTEFDTLQSVTDRGATTDVPISFTSAVAATSALTGALTVTGGVGIGGDLYVAGTINGAVLLPGDPTTELAATTKQYVDNATAAVAAQIPPPGLTEADVADLIADAIANLQGTPTGVVTNVDVGSGNATIAGASWATTDTYNIINATVTGRTVTMPSGVSGTRTIVSARTNTRAVTIIKGTTTYRLPAGGFIIVYLDGSANYMRVIAAGGASADYVLRSGDQMNGVLLLNADPTVNLAAATKQYVDGKVPPLVLAAFVAGLPATEATVFEIQITAANAFTLPAGAANCSVRSSVAATGSTTWTLTKNGASVGTFQWSASGTIATITVSSNVSFAAGDTLAVTRTLPADGTLDKVRITLAGPRA